MEYLYDLKEKLCDELEEYASKKDMSAGDLEMVHKLTDTIKNIDKISILEEDEGYSQAGDRMYRSTYERGSSYRGRRRDSMGRYSKEGNYGRNGTGRTYSRDSAKDKMMDHLEAMMDEAGSEKEREAIQRCMRQLENA